MVPHTTSELEEIGVTFNGHYQDYMGPPSISSNTMTPHSSTQHWTLDTMTGILSPPLPSTPLTREDIIAAISSGVYPTEGEPIMPLSCPNQFRMPKEWLTSPIPLNVTKDKKMELYPGKKRGRGKEGSVKIKGYELLKEHLLQQAQGGFAMSEQEKAMEYDAAVELAKNTEAELEKLSED